MYPLVDGLKLLNVVPPLDIGRESGKASFFTSVHPFTPSHMRLAASQLFVGRLCRICPRHSIVLVRIGILAVLRPNDTLAATCLSVYTTPKQP